MQVAEEVKARLRRLHAQTDPVVVLAEMRAAQAGLGERVDRRGMEPAQSITVDLDRFTAFVLQSVNPRGAVVHAVPRPAADLILFVASIPDSV